MENAVEALKLATVVIVFVLAVSLAFMLFTQTKTTADSIFYIRDSQKYMEQEGLEGIIYTSSGVDTNRTVTMAEVISTIYRYPKENYGVTIIVGNEVYARYDITTEEIINRWNGTYEQDSIYTDAGIELPEINKHLNYLASLTDGIIDYDSEKWKEKLKYIYSIYRDGATPPEYTASPWRSNDVAIAKRIGADITGTSITINDIDTYNDGTSGRQVKCLSDYNDKHFKEILKVVDNNVYVDIGEEDNKDYLQERKISKTEIIYVMQ